MSGNEACKDFEENILPTLYGVPSQAYLNACLALAIFTFAYYIVGLFIYLYYRKKMLRLQSKSIYMTISFTISMLLYCEMVVLREYFGREHFQCRAFMWITYLTLTFGSGSYIGNLYTYIYKLRIQRDQGFQIMLQQKTSKKIGDVNSPVSEKKRTEPSALFYLWEYLSALKYSRNGKIFVPGYDDSNDNVSSNGSESVAGNAIYVFSSDSQDGDFTMTMFERIKEEFLYPTMVLFIFGSLVIVCGIIRASFEPLIYNNCVGCPLTWVDYAVLGPVLAINATIIVIALYAIRNEADPLGVLIEAKVGALCCALGAPLCVFQVVDPGHVYMDYKFTWDITFAFLASVLYFPTSYGHLIKSHFERRSKRRAGTMDLSTFNEKRVGSSSPERNNGYSLKNLPPASALDVNLIIQEPRARNALLEHAVNELSSENLVFVFKVRAWKALWEKEQPAKINKIATNLYNEHIAYNAKAQINIPNGVLSRIEKAMSVYVDTTGSAPGKSGNVTPIVSNKIPNNIFDECEHECINIIKTDTLPRFRNSPLFKERIVETGILNKVLAL